MIRTSPAPQPPVPPATPVASVEALEAECNNLGMQLLTVLELMSTELTAERQYRRFQLLMQELSASLDSIVGGVGRLREIDRPGGSAAIEQELREKHAVLEALTRKLAAHR